MKPFFVLVLATGIVLAVGGHASGPITAPGWTGVEEFEEQSPVPEGEPDWGEDDEIRDIDSVIQVHLDWHDSLDYLYCVLRYEGNGYTHSIKPLVSTNGGTSWGGPTTFYSVNEIPGFDIAVLDDYVYMVQGKNLPTRTVYINRFQAHNMRWDTFPNGEYSIPVGEYTSDIVECRIETNRFGPGARIYVGVITADHKTHFFWIPTYDFDYRYMGRSLFPDDALHGLNMCWNEEHGGYMLLFSYINTSGQVQVYGFTYTTPDTHRFNVSPPTNGSYTGLAAWQDTFIVTYDYASTDGIQARYMTSYDEGATWRWGFFGDTTQPTVRSADVTARNGYGQAVSFWQYPQQSGGVSFTHRRYAGPWTTPVRIQDHESYSNRVSDIEHIGNGLYGIVYIRGTANGKAYFDRSDWTGIRGPAPIPGLFPVDPQQSVVRKVLYLPSAANGRRAPAPVLLDAASRTARQLHPGPNDVSGLPAGVYFLNSAAGTGIERKVVITR